ncbi:hypothetical protein RchiOBHm_Chr6g0255811 [Rosa chinensis]|uniref:Uncharacterized protein n=1 Tax=Rosa chinensis TaxID=74649 RepID=A0A2P6PLY3_ROSCH|nr:hypothetical protein RchiOBHm_Chr6g0255811 [Rosa chinensis]
MFPYAFSLSSLIPFLQLPSSCYLQFLQRLIRVLKKQVDMLNLVGDIDKFADH